MTNEQYIELEELYNTLLMQHESLPSDIHRDWNQKAMDTIDEALIKHANEQIIIIDTQLEEIEEKVKLEDIQEVEVKYDYYEPNIAGIYEQVNETTIELYAYNHVGWNMKIARFNFLNGTGYYYDLNGDIHHVERYSTIVKRLNKIDEKFYGINTLTVENIKNTVRKIRRERKKAI